jgi:hypothetical protein
MDLTRAVDRVGVICRAALAELAALESAPAGEGS